MTNKGKYYESQFEEATIGFSERHTGNMRLVMTFTGNIPTHSLKRT